MERVIEAEGHGLRKKKVKKSEKTMKSKVQMRDGYQRHKKLARIEEQDPYLG